MRLALRWIPGEVLAKPFAARRLFENPATVQFNHRLLAYLTLAAAFALAAKRRPALPSPIKVGAAASYV